MSIVVKQPQHGDARYLALVIVAVACLCQMHRTGPSGPQQPLQQDATVLRSQAQQAALEATVSGFVGVDKSRGDSISVVIVPGDQSR